MELGGRTGRLGPASSGAWLGPKTINMAGEYVCGF